MMLSHRTDLKHESAVTRAAGTVGTCKERFHDGLPTEDELAAKMAEDAKAMPKFSQHGNIGQCRRENTEEKIFAALVRRMTAPQISKVTGMSEETIRRNMSRLFTEGRVRREGTVNARIWSKA